MVPVRYLDIAVIGDEELVNALRLAGVSRHYRIDDNQEARENVRRTLAALLSEPGIGIVVISEDYAHYVADLLAQLRRRKGTTPVVVEVPSKRGTKYPDARAYYRALIRESIGFDVEI